MSTVLRDIDQEFLDFHQANAAVYDTLVRLARDAKSKGKDKGGIGMFWEVMRWEMWLSTTGADFRLNNNYRSRYARLIEHRERDLRGFFETRELRS